MSSKDTFDKAMADFNRTYPKDKVISTKDFQRDILMLHFIQARSITAIQEQGSHVISKLSEIADAAMVTAHSVYDSENEITMRDYVDGLEERVIEALGDERENLVIALEKLFEGESPWGNESDEVEEPTEEEPEKKEA